MKTELKALAHGANCSMHLPTLLAFGGTGEQVEKRAEFQAESEQGEAASSSVLRSMEQRVTEGS